MLIVALLCGILVFFLFLLAVEYFTRDKMTVARKVRHYTSGEAAEWEEPVEKQDLASGFMSFVRYLGLKLRAVATTRVLDNKMQQAGLPVLGSEFLVLLAVVGLGCGVLGLMLTLRVSYAVLSAFAGIVVSWLYLRWRIAGRHAAFTNQLGDALSMMANALRSGFSFMQSLELIAKELQPPISVEFAKTIAEVRLGADMEPALLNMGKRVHSADLDLVITAVLIQRQVGGNLAQILDMIGQTINERIKIKREIRTLTTQGRASGWILAALPFAVGGIIAAFNPNYLKPLFYEPVGQIFVAGALALEIIGFLIIRRIVDIDV